MGVCDFTCFVQRNGQSLFALSTSDGENDSDEDISSLEGSASAILVIIPRNGSKISKRIILSWKLSQFAKYDTIKTGYNWDSREFDELPGYSDVLDNDKWTNTAIWKNKDNYIVNFEEGAYKAFVEEKLASDKISLKYYEIIFENRNLPCPATKDLAYKKIFDCGAENLWEYDDKILDLLDVEIRYNSVLEQKEKILKKYSTSYTMNPIPNIKRTRVAILIKDNLQTAGFNHPQDIIINASPTLPESAFCTEVKGVLNIKVYFKLTIGRNYFDGCIRCGKRRWIGSYMCLKHQYKFEESIDKYEKKINREIENIKALNITGKAPKKITVSFDEKDQLYEVVLTHK